MTCLMAWMPAAPLTARGTVDSVTAVQDEAISQSPASTALERRAPDPFVTDPGSPSLDGGFLRFDGDSNPDDRSGESVPAFDLPGPRGQVLDGSPELRRADR